jgi:WD40 repeat protein
VGTGKATATLSMKWEGVPVAPTQYTLDVRDALGGKSLPVSSRLVRSLPHPDRAANVTGLQFTRKGTLFTAGDPSGVVQMWEPSSGKELRRIQVPRDSARRWGQPQPSADFATLFVTTYGQKVIDTGADPKRPRRMEYDSKVLAWDLATGKPKAMRKPPSDVGIYDTQLSPDGSRLISHEWVSGQVDGGVPAAVCRMIDTVSGRSWKLADGLGMAAFSPDSKRVYVAVRFMAGKREGGLLVFDRDGKRRTPLVALGVQPWSSPIISPDGKWLVARVRDGGDGDRHTLKVFDLATGQVVQTINPKGDTFFFGPTISPDGSFMTALETKGHLRVFGTAKWSVVLEHQMKGLNWGGLLAFTADGRRLAVPMQAMTDDGTRAEPDPLDYPQPRIYLFDLEKPIDPPEEIVCPHGWMRSVAFSPDGKTLAFGSTGAVHLFDVSGPAK